MFKTIISFMLVVLLLLITCSGCMNTGKKNEVQKTDDADNISEQDDSSIPAADIVVNRKITYQYIDGFGCNSHGSTKAVYSNKNFYDNGTTAKGNQLFDYLYDTKTGAGLSISRVSIVCSDTDGPQGAICHEPAPGVWEWNHDEFHIWAMKEARKRGVQRFCALPWSPPAWMKENKNVNGVRSKIYPNITDGPVDHPNYTRNHLKPEMYGELATYLSEYVKEYQKSKGIFIGWVGINNEADYEGLWATCFFSPETLKKVIPIVGKKLQENNPGTFLMAADTSRVTTAKKYLDEIMADPNCVQYLQFLSTHSYVNTTGYDQLNYSGTRIWQTEFCMTDRKEASMTENQLWNDIEFYTTQIHNFLVNGNFSSWFYWRGEDKIDATSGTCY